MTTTSATSAPRVGAGISTLHDAASAARSALDGALAPLGPEGPDLVFLFVSPQFEAEQRPILDLVIERTGGAVVLGCSAGGVIGAGKEVEDAPAVSIWAARLPGARIEPLRLTFAREEDHGIIEGFDPLPEATEHPVVVLIADPFTFPADLLLEHLNEAAPGVPVVGGMASGGLERGRNALFFDEEIVRDGAIGVVISGAVGLAAVVSQGCRPVGQTYAVTRAERNVVFELGGQPAMSRIEEVYAASTERDQILMRRGLHIGQAVSELKPELRRGDFLVRNLLGIDPETGALAISDVAEVGQTVQFQVRDAEAAREDLSLLLERERAVRSEPVVGALLFSCNGRGQALFGQPDHDVTAVRRTFGGVPVGGFFAAGELGPIAGRNFLHGFTASLLLVRDGGAAQVR
ncbi:MAG: FIST signal transduction protein [Candidatus Limnocylindria bacterium]